MIFKIADYDGLDMWSGERREEKILQTIMEENYQEEDLESDG